MAIDSTDNIYSVVQQEFRILAEVKMIQSENIGGVYVIPSHESSFLWFGVLFVRDGPYSDGVFRFNISLPKSFPNTEEPPTVIFQSESSHPLICPYTGLLNIADAFSTWNNAEDHLWQLLKYVQFVFEHPVGCVNEDRTNVANKDTFELIRENKMAEFKEKVKECVRISKDKVYDAPPTEDKHYITFNLFDEDVHKGVLDSIRNQTDASSISPPPTGLSWVKPGEFKPLSK